MRHKNALLFLLIFICGFVSSCKKKSTATVSTTKEYVVDAAKTRIDWTAFKTTDRVPVKGNFTRVHIKQKAAKSRIEALNEVQFSIPTNSLFSNNPERDSKLKTLFFNAMKETVSLSGTVHIQDATNGFVNFSMNGITEKLPFTYVLKEEVVAIKAIMNTNTWQAQKAMESLNNACFDLHKGSDGISKIWSDVLININVYFVSNKHS